mgnify:FL=1
MGYYVTLSVIFACNKNGAVAELARAHIARLPTEDSPESVDEARWFLEALSQRTGDNLGPKGGLSCWGTVGNYTHVDEFVEVLKPFWIDLLHEVEGGPLEFEHVMVLYENEQAEHASAYEIFQERLEGDRQFGDLIIRHHPDLPFAWMQM